MAAPLLFQMLKFRGNIYAIITSPKEILCTSKYLNFNISSTHYAKKKWVIGKLLCLAGPLITQQANYNLPENQALS